MKEPGFSHWQDPNAGATNESGFTALPGGSLNKNWNRYSLGAFARYWSASMTGTSNAWYRWLSYDFDGVYRLFGNRGNGFSVRCIRD